MGATATLPTTDAARVLLVDADPAWLGASTQCLEWAGHRVTAVADPAEARRLLAQDSERFDVVVSEIAMPGMSGPELLEWCRQENVTVPFIFLTTLRHVAAVVDTSLMAHRKGAHCCLPKHTNMQHLAAAVERSATDARTNRQWRLRLRRLEVEAADRADSLEAARAQAEQGLRDLKQAQIQLLESEKMASIGQLAAGVAHEINNPIGFIYSNMSTLRDYVADVKEFMKRSTEVQKCLAEDDPAAATRLSKSLEQWRREVDVEYMLDDIDKLVAETIDGAERVKKIVMDLRSFSRIDQAQKTTADINQGLLTTINVCSNELKYRCDVVKELGDIPEIVCYPMKLNQVFMNLIVNAAQAIKEKGTVTVRTFRDGDYVCVQVSDTGCGIAKENLGKIFDPFFTTKPVGKGTGLGLSIAYGIVAEHNGKIEVESEVGKGTTFTVRLPAGGPSDA